LPRPDPEKFARLLAPKSIAFIGGGIAEMAILRSREIGFAGDMWPVHPHKDEFAGLPCFRSVQDLPGVPDAAFIGVRRELTIEVVRELADAGAGGCVCYAAGFAEMGDAGAELQRHLVEAAGDMPLVGPNCFGLINYVDRCALWPYLFGGQSPERGVALISQSGNIAMNLTMNDRSVRFTHVIGAGNQAVLGPADYVNTLLKDDRVSAIGMYIEGFDDVQAFAHAAIRAAEKNIPIVVMKVGKTEASARQSSSHTSSLTGSDVLYDAFFDRLGVIRVDSLNRLLETLKILDHAGPLTGRNIFTLSCSGGEAATIADLAPRYELRMDEFSPAQIADLESQFPNYVTVSNPFDYNTSIWGQAEALERCFTSSMQGNHDAGILVYDHPTVEAEEVDEWIQALDAFAAAHKASGKPAFVICTISELLPKKVRDRALAAGVIPLQGLEDGLYAYAAAARYHEQQRDRKTPISLQRPNVAIEDRESITLNEAESKRRLAEFGIAIPAGGMTSAGNAPVVAESLGFPVVLKAVAKNLVHKSELGVVALNLRSADAVRDATTQIQQSCRQNDIDGPEFLLEKMVTDVVAELIVGINRDLQFGPTLVIGSGGIFVELLKDSVNLLLPTDRESVLAAIGSLRVATPILGFRNRPQGDLQAAADAVLAIAAFAEAHWDKLLELDVNPLMVTQNGAVAADAVMVFSGQPD